MKNFLELYLEGSVTIDDLDDFLAKWHDGNDSHPVYEWLGLTRDQYFKWCRDPELLKQELDTLKRRTTNKDIARELVVMAKELLKPDANQHSTSGK